MPSPDVNRVRIIGEELLPELQCPQDPLPEKLKVLLELLVKLYQLVHKHCTETHPQHMLPWIYNNLDIRGT